jgi:hypothetical protein
VNEKIAPEILEYQADLVQEVTAALTQQVKHVQLFVWLEQQPCSIQQPEAGHQSCSCLCYEQACMQLLPSLCDSLHQQQSRPRLPPYAATPGLLLHMVKPAPPRRV